jgi:hypothetical protein
VWDRPSSQSDSIRQIERALAVRPSATRTTTLMLALIIPLSGGGEHLPALPPVAMPPIYNPIDPGFGRPPWRPVDPGYGHPRPPVDPGYGRPPWSPVDPGWGVRPPVDPGWGVRPPVDPGYGRPGWSPVDPGYGVRPPVDPGYSPFPAPGVVIPQPPPPDKPSAGIDPIPIGDTGWHLDYWRGTGWVIVPPEKPEPQPKPAK